MDHVFLTLCTLLAILKFCVLHFAQILLSVTKLKRFVVAYGVYMLCNDACMGLYHMCSDIAVS